MRRLKQLSLLLLLSLFSVTASAEADGPDYWQVRDVKKDHVLNMRSHADINASKVGKIPSHANCIRNMGCSGGLSFKEFTTLSEAQKQQILKQRPRWCRVNYKGVTAWVAGAYLREGSCPDGSEHKTLSSVKSLDPFNHHYVIESEEVLLHNGDASKAIPDSSALVITRIIYTPVFGKLKTDGPVTVATVLAQQTGGSGTFYYLAVAAENGDAVESYFLGDRIHIKLLKIEDEIIIVDYLERAEGQAMAMQPTLKRSKRFVLEDGKVALE